MTKTEKNTVPATAEPLPVDAKKLIEALGTIFGGVIQLLTAVEPDIAKELADFAINGESQKNLPENLNIDDFEEIISEEELPSDTVLKKQETPAPQEQPSQKEKEQASSVTADDLTKIIVQKIKQKRSNSEKIGAILKTYGVAKVSELPPDKYEAFITDVSQL
jgi:hypothetical protein